MTTAALNSNVQLANALATMLPSLFGKKEIVSGGGKTEQTILSTEAVQGLLTQLMEGSGLAGSGRPGLAAIARGQKGAGLYNSSTNMQLVNDLMSRISSEVAIAGSPRVTTAEPKVMKQQGALGGAGMLLPIALIAGSKAGKKKLSEAYESLFGKATTTAGTEADWMTGTAGMDFASVAPELNTATNAAGAAAMTLGDTLDLTDFGGVSTLGASAAASDTIDLSSFDFNLSDVDTFSGAADAFSAVGDVSDWYSGVDAISGATDVAGGIGDFTGIPYLSSVMNLAQGDIQGAALTGLGFAVGGPIGGAIGGLVDMILGDDSGCFITTAIMRAVGGGDTSPELSTLRQYRDTWLRENHPEAIEEYYQIAPQIVAQINQSPQSGQIWKSLWKAFLIPALQEITNGRNERAYQIYKEMVMVAKERSAH